MHSNFIRKELTLTTERHARKSATLQKLFLDKERIVTACPAQSQKLLARQGVPPLNILVVNWYRTRGCGNLR